MRALFQFAAGGGSGGKRRPWCGVRCVSAAGAGARRVPFARAFGCAAEDRLRRENSLPTLKQAGNLELRCEELSCAVAGGATGRGRTARDVAKGGGGDACMSPVLLTIQRPTRVPTAEVLSHNFAMTNRPRLDQCSDSSHRLLRVCSRRRVLPAKAGTFCPDVRGISLSC